MLRFRPTAITLAGLFLAWIPCAPQTVSRELTSPQSTMDEVVDRAIARERALIEMLKTRTPLIETYLQDLRFDPRDGPVPVGDHYFLGRMDLAETVDRRDYLPKRGGFQRILLGGFSRLYKIEYNLLGFSWMIFADRNDFNRQTYEPQPRNTYFFHMDSWRQNLVPGYWVPAYVYSEEGDDSYGSKNEIGFKAQSRLWGYDLQTRARDSEFTDIVVDSKDSTVKDQSPTAQDASPMEAQRLWMQQAADNVIERLQTAGLLAPEGELNKVLETVVNNLLITNHIDLLVPVHVRLMLTSPLETFSVGNTIIVSRGLIDVLPDEASLAAVLAHELAHIVLGHNIGTKFAFSDRLLFSDESIYGNFGFRHSPEEEAIADKKAIDLLKDSPYARNLATAGLFLRQVAEQGSALTALLTAHLGDGFTDKKGRVTRMVALMNSAPTLDHDRLDQISALPLGGRIKVNAWDDRAELIKTKPAVINSARDKMPLEVTPFFPHLARYGPIAIPATTTAAKTGN